MIDWLLNILKNINDEYSYAIQALTPIVFGVVSVYYFKFVKEKEMKSGDAALLIKPSFKSFGKKYEIQAVHEFEKSDSNSSGYNHLGQNSRPDQWGKLIKVESKFFNCYHKVTSKTNKTYLQVHISRDGTEKWKIIEFNK